jgi:hypothetical protein
MLFWQPFVAALTELYEFAVESLPFCQKDKVVSPEAPLALPTAAPIPLLQRHETPLLSEKSDTRSLLTQATAYVVIESAQVFARPVWAFDSVIGILPYGATVSVLGFQGRFAEISYQTLVGWVHKDALTESKVNVWPALKDGMVYEALAPETVLIRKLLKDEFFASELYLPLQPQEFISYALLTRKQLLPKTTIRPRLPGLWHEIYKGKPGVTIGLQPKTGSIMEAFPSDHESFIGLVTAVHVDESVVVETVGKAVEGCYQVESFSKSDWQSIQCT